MAYTDYAPLFAQAQAQYPDLPPGILASQDQWESGFNPNAVSPAGARGISQFMPATARNMGVDPTDPQSSIFGQAALMHTNLQRYGNITDALRAYNGGNNFANIPSTATYASNVLATMPKYAPHPVQNSVQPSGGPPVASLGSLASSPVDLGDTSPGQLPAPNSLGSLAGLPQLKARSKFTAGNVLGVLGDALSAYGGRQPTFGPFLQQEKILGQQQDFERQKFQQELQMRMFALTHPQEWMQAQAFNYLPPEQQRAILHYQDATNPINVSTPQGTQNLPRTATRTINGKNYYSIGGQWFEEDGQ